MKRIKALLRTEKVDHYKQQQNNIQPIQLATVVNLNFCQGNVIKYISRCEQKGKHLDLNKALDYLYWGCQIIENNQDSSMLSKFVLLDHDARFYGLEEFDRFYYNFINQHDDVLNELLMFAINAEAHAINGIYPKLIESIYNKFNDVSILKFNEELTSNIFYDKYKELSNAE